MYQIYPRSFQDGDGNGVGDLRGIRQRLPYLSELGVDALWISPIFPSNTWLDGGAATRDSNRLDFRQYRYLSR